MSEIGVNAPNLALSISCLVFERVVGTNNPRINFNHICRVLSNPNLL